MKDDIRFMAMREILGLSQSKAMRISEVLKPELRVPPGESVPRLFYRLSAVKEMKRQIAAAGGIEKFQEKFYGHTHTGRFVGMGRDQMTPRGNNE